MSERRTDIGLARLLNAEKEGLRKHEVTAILDELEELRGQVAQRDELIKLLEENSELSKRLVDSLEKQLADQRARDIRLMEVCLFGISATELGLAAKLYDKLSALPVPPPAEKAGERG